MNDNHILSVTGQNEVSEQLLNIYKTKKIPHAFLFEGTSGCGKFRAAAEFAKLLFSKSDKSTEISDLKYLQEPFFKFVIPLPRGKGETSDHSPTEKLKDEDIKLIQEELNSKIINPYHIISIPDANNIKISSIRDVRKCIAMNYSDIKYRFIFFDNAHLMTEDAQNAFLKSLEEPPEGVIFIISTTDKEKLLPTILSRCWLVKFRPLNIDHIVEILVKYFSTDKNYAERVSFFADGSIEKAVYLINNNFDEFLDDVINIIRFSMANLQNTSWEYLSKYIIDNENEYSFLLIDVIKKWLMDVISVKYGKEIVYFVKYPDTIHKFISGYNNVDIFNVIKRIDEITGYFKNNVNLNILWMNIIFELTSLVKRS